MFYLFCNTLFRQVLQNPSEPDKFIASEKGVIFVQSLIRVEYKVKFLSFGLLATIGTRTVYTYKLSRVSLNMTEGSSTVSDTGLPKKRIL